jgi:hypothetical protein
MSLQGRYLRTDLHRNPLRDDTPYQMDIGGGGGAEFFLYTLNGSMTGSSVTARIRAIDDGTEISASDPVVNLLSMFSDQVINDRGVCFQQGGRYYAIQAPCGAASSTSTPSPGGGLSGSLPIGSSTVSF